METINFEIIPSRSSIDWTGRKIMGAHNGTVDIKAGSLLLDAGKLVAGKFSIDTGSIRIMDISDIATNAQFASHLASDDFFASRTFPTADFETSSVTPLSGDAYHVEGNLTIKGITAPVSFDATVGTSGGLLTATGKISVDRTKYGMKFRSGSFFNDLGDNLIYNEFDLDVHITAKAA